jgi:hypothetical protein
VLSGAAASGERRATIPLYHHEAAGAGAITLGDAFTASAAIGAEATTHVPIVQVDTHL